jgi:hypothetical protein
MENVSVEENPVLFSLTGRLRCSHPALNPPVPRLTACGGRRCILQLVLFAVLHAYLSGGQFHVTADASSSGTGTPANPWQLQVAVHHQPAVKPGDTIWVHGGVYRGQFTCALDGTPTLPVVVRNYRNERATIVEPGGNWGAGIALIGSYTWLWGLEVDSNPDAPLNTPAPGINIAGGTTSPGLKVINCVIHDQVGGGFGWWVGAIDGEINGCLVYFNGRQEGVGNNAHNYGIYMQNVAGRKLFKDNILPYNWSYAVHAYSEQGGVNNILFDGNAMYQSGFLWRGTASERNLIIGGSAAAGRDADTIRNNHFFYHSSNTSAGERLTIGYYAPMSNLGMSGNVIVGGIMEFRLVSGSVTGNTMIGTTGDSPPGNSYQTAGSGTVIAVRPNDYEKERGNIIVYNFDRDSSVTADVSPIGLQRGDRYEVRDALNFYGDPVAGGSYTGKGVRIPMVGLTVARPTGVPAAAPFHTAPEFGVFVLLAPQNFPPRVRTEGNPEEFRLGKNFPNPFKTYTKMSFSVAAEGDVLIEVLDVHGKSVAPVVDGRLKPGIYETGFFGTGLPPGIYIYRMKAGRFESTQKMLLIG